jgi:hypothetical protein
MALLATVATLLLAGQLVYFNRTRIAAEVPESRPALEAFCSLAGCKVPWPSDIARFVPNGRSWLSSRNMPI